MRHRAPPRARSSTATERPAAPVSALNLDGGGGARGAAAAVEEDAKGRLSARAVMRQRQAPSQSRSRQGRASTAGAAAMAQGRRASALPSIPAEKANSPAAAASAEPVSAHKAARRLLGTGDARPPTPMRKRAADAAPKPSLYSASSPSPAGRHEPLHRSARPMRGILSASPQQRAERHRRRVARLRRHLERRNPLSSSSGCGSSGSNSSSGGGGSDEGGGSDSALQLLRFADEEGLPLARVVEVRDFHYSSDGDVGRRSQPPGPRGGPARVRLASGALVSPRGSGSGTGAPVEEEGEEDGEGVVGAFFTGMLGLFDGGSSQASEATSPAPSRHIPARPGSRRNGGQSTALSASVPARRGEDSECSIV